MPTACQARVRRDATSRATRIARATASGPGDRGNTARAQAWRNHRVLDLATGTHGGANGRAGRQALAAADGRSTAFTVGRAPGVICARLGETVTAITFDRDVMAFPTLSPPHDRKTIEAPWGPVAKLVAALARKPVKLRAFRVELDAFWARHFENDALR